MKQVHKDGLLRENRNVQGVGVAMSDNLHLLSNWHTKNGKKGRVRALLVVGEGRFAGELNKRALT
jgi:hypothetical protein